MGCAKTLAAQYIHGVTDGSRNDDKRDQRDQIDHTSYAETIERWREEESDMTNATPVASMAGGLPPSSATPTTAKRLHNNIPASCNDDRTGSSAVVRITGRSTAAAHAAARRWAGKTTRWGPDLPVGLVRLADWAGFRAGTTCTSIGPAELMAL